MNSKDMEKYSSAITLSDMEIFVFPELMYSLVLANIMSPIIWRWREEECFKKLRNKNGYKKLLRLRQYIMDEYEFNLDLETWGLTDKSKELKRFEEIASAEDIMRSNALFGYHGDKYYFDVDIRKHFGLDKYDDDVIPYWKTETVEAMDAFRFKADYTKKAGECVSLSALYVAAAFIVCQIPLEDIYMVLTPLHSQNFIDINDGLITNNRRVVTKAMWFNGTATSIKAQRALKNEQVTAVAHSSGYVHCMYDNASINKEAYSYFSQRLGRYLSTNVDPLIFASFLRAYRDYQKYFQFCRTHRGERKFVKAEILFHYEHGSKFRIADDTFEKLLAEVSDEDYSPYYLSDRVCCEKLQEFIESEKLDIQREKDRQSLITYLNPHIPGAEIFVELLADYVHTEAKLPSMDKVYMPNKPITLSVDQSREEIIEYLQDLRGKNMTADLSFYAYRDMENCDWAPFIKAAFERNPVSIEATGNMSVGQAYEWLGQMNDESIYDGKRFAQPDEVTNYGRGDGIEKAFVLANIIRDREPGENIEIIIDNKNVVLKTASKEYRFISAKEIRESLQLPE